MNIPYNKAKKVAYLNTFLSENNISRRKASKILEVQPTTVSNYLNHPEKPSSELLDNWTAELKAFVDSLGERSNVATEYDSLHSSDDSQQASKEANHE